MDGFDDFTARINAQKRAMQAAKGRKGQKATNKASRYEIELTYINRIAMPADLYKLRNCFIAFAYPPSTTPIQDLKPIKLSELRLETRHVGRVLIVRIFTPAKRIVSVQAGIEDEDEDVDHIGLYNADPKLKAEQILPKDAVFAVKEPYYKPSASGGYMVRVGECTPESFIMVVTNRLKIIPPTSSDCQTLTTSSPSLSNRASSS